MKSLYGLSSLVVGVVIFAMGAHAEEPAPVAEGPRSSVEESGPAEPEDAEGPPQGDEDGGEEEEEEEDEEEDEIQDEAEARKASPLDVDPGPGRPARERGQGIAPPAARHFVAGAVGAVVGAAVGGGLGVALTTPGFGRGDVGVSALLVLASMVPVTAVGAYLGLLFDLDAAHALVPAALAGASAPLGVIGGAFVGSAVAATIGIPVGIVLSFLIRSPIGIFVIVPFGMVGAVIGAGAGGLVFPGVVAAAAPTFLPSTFLPPT